LTNPAAVLDYAPVAAAAFAIPQFLPQIRKLLATADTAGVSGSWATLTSVNNAAWFTYFALSGYWFALLPSSSATLLAGTLAVLLGRRGATNRRAGVLILAWAVLLTPRGAGHAAHGRVRPPGDAAALDGLSHRSPNRSLVGNLVAGTR